VRPTLGVGGGKAFELVPRARVVQRGVFGVVAVERRRTLAGGVRRLARGLEVALADVLGYFGVFGEVENAEKDRPDDRAGEDQDEEEEKRLFRRRRKPLLHVSPQACLREFRLPLLKDSGSNNIQCEGVRSQCDLFLSIYIQFLKRKYTSRAPHTE
jgi:hypothetical protein